MSEIDARKHGYWSTAHNEIARGTSASYGTVYDRGELDFGPVRRYPKGLRANAAGTAVLQSLSGNTVPVVLAAGQEVSYRFKQILATASFTHGTSTIDNFVLIWD